MTKKEIKVVEEVLYATKIHFQAICGLDDPSMQDVIDGMDISITKLDSLLPRRKQCKAGSY